METRHVLTILAVEDLGRSARFWSDAFGWPRTVDVPVYVELALPGGMRLGLYSRDAFGRNTGHAPARTPTGAIGPTELYFRVEDVEVAARRVEAAGGRLLSALAPREWGDEAAYLADPDGNVVVVARPLEPAGDTATAEGLAVLARRWMTLWEGADLALVEALHAPDFVDHSPAGRPADLAGFRRGIEEFRAAFPDLAATADDLVPDPASGKVTVRWSAAGTHAGPFLGFAPTGRVVRLRGIEVIRVRSGRVVERWGEWDGLDLLAQLEGRPT